MKEKIPIIERCIIIFVIILIGVIILLYRTVPLPSRLVCGTNLKGLGITCMIYAQEHDEKFPVAGGEGNNRWAAFGQQDDYWDNPDFDWTGDQQMSLSASLYLLIRYTDVSPNIFVCTMQRKSLFRRVIRNEEPFEGLDSQGKLPQDPDLDIIEMWDFGDKPWLHNSYAYHNPYFTSEQWPAKPLSGMSDPDMPIMADKNPWFDDRLNRKPAINSWKRSVGLINNGMPVKGIVDWDSVSLENIQIGNSPSHLREGQNVVYMDGHCSFERRSDVGFDNDNIYCSYDLSLPDETDQKRRGLGSSSAVKDEYDSVLINDGQNSEK